MNYIVYSFKQLKRNPWATGFTLVFAAFACALNLFVSQLNYQTDKQVIETVSGVDLVVGAKGSALQLVLSSLFYLDNPTGNIELSKIPLITKSPLVKEIQPISLGDNAAGYRIIGATPEILKFLDLRLKRGKPFERLFEAVVGADLVAETGWELGYEFTSNHGKTEASTHEDKYLVTGVLEKCGCPSDRVIYVSNKSVQHSHESKSDEVTALLVKTISALGKLQLPRLVNERTPYQAAIPSIESDRLLQLSAGAFKTLQVFGYLFFIVCCAAMLTTFMMRIDHLTRNAAIMQVQGLSRTKSMGLVLLQMLFLAWGGFILGIVLYQMLTVWASYALSDYGFQLPLLPKFQYLGVSFLGLHLAVGLAILVPILKFFKIQLHQVLTNGAN